MIPLIRAIYCMYIAKKGKLVYILLRNNTNSGLLLWGIDYTNIKINLVYRCILFKYLGSDANY